MKQHDRQTATDSKTARDKTARAVALFAIQDHVVNVSKATDSTTDSACCLVDCRQYELACREYLSTTCAVLLIDELYYKRDIGLCGSPRIILRKVRYNL